MCWGFSRRHHLSRCHLHHKLARSLFLCGFQCYFNILPEDHQKFHQAAHGHGNGFEGHQGGDLWLGGAQKFCGFGLREVAFLEQSVHLYRELCFRGYGDTPQNYLWDFDGVVEGIRLRG